jgi:hypothetical protein
MEEKEGPSTIDKEESYSSQWENTTIDKSAANGNIRGLELLVPWLTIASTVATKTAYTEMLLPMEDLLCLCQQGDAFVRKKAKELSSAEHNTKDLTWSIKESGLL